MRRLEVHRPWTPKQRMSFRKLQPSRRAAFMAITLRCHNSNPSHNARQQTLPQLLMPTSTQSKHSPHMHINGPSKPAVRTNPISKLGTTRMEKGDCSVLIYLTRVAKFEAQGSTSSVINYTRSFEKEGSTTSQAPVGCKWRRSSSQT